RRQDARQGQREHERTSEQHRGARPAQRGTGELPEDPVVGERQEHGKSERDEYDFHRGPLPITRPGGSKVAEARVLRDSPPMIDDQITMTTIYREEHAALAPLQGATVAVVGYGNQGRSWALNLRDSGCDVCVCVRADATRDQAQADGFSPAEIDEASAAQIVCVLVPDDVITRLPLVRPDDGLTIVASGYSLAFGGFAPAGDVGLVAPRMLGPEVRSCYLEGTGFITALGVHQDRTGRALARTLAVAKAIGGVRQGAIEMEPHPAALLDLARTPARYPEVSQPADGLR